jgi:hypothetical protein
VENYLNTELEKSSLATLDVKLRYVPIVMPPEIRKRYPERSKLRKNKKLYDCARQLDFDVFVGGSLRNQVTEYVRGIRLSVPYLAKLGASPEQVTEFSEILSRVPSVMAP